MDALLTRWKVNVHQVQPLHISCVCYCGFASDAKVANHGCVWKTKREKTKNKTKNWSQPISPSCWLFPLSYILLVLTEESRNSMLPVLLSFLCARTQWWPIYLECIRVFQLTKINVFFRDSWILGSVCVFNQVAVNTVCLASVRMSEMSPIHFLTRRKSIQRLSRSVNKSKRSMQEMPNWSAVLWSIMILLLVWRPS